MNLNKKNTKQLMFIIAFAALMLWIVFNYKLFIDLIFFILKLLAPLIVGIGIAFIINVPMKKIEKKIFKIDKRKHKKLVRVISFIASIIIIFGIIGLIMFLIVPEFLEAVSNISKNIPKGYDWLNGIIDKLQKLYPNANEYIKKFDLNNLMNSSSLSASNIVSLVISFLSGLVSKLIIFFVGFIISIYILLDKESLSKGAKRIITAFTSEKITDKVVSIVKLANTTFTNFLTGQCLDACLTGFIFFIVLSIIRLPYALILGVLFTVTALIPYIGAFITLVIGAILIGVTNPIGALYYVIVFFIVQQFDDNFTYPKIVGGSVGLPPLWSLIAVLIGGSIFGFIGMIISIPIASILYSLLKNYVSECISKKEERFKN